MSVSRNTSDRGRVKRKRYRRMLFRPTARARGPNFRWKARVAAKLQVEQLACEFTARWSRLDLLAITPFVLTPTPPPTPLYVVATTMVHHMVGVEWWDVRTVNSQVTHKSTRFASANAVCVAPLQTQKHTQQQTGGEGTCTSKHANITHTNTKR